VLRLVKLNRVERVRLAGQPWVRKQRRIYAWLLIVLSHKRLRCNTHCEAQWITWETALAAQRKLRLRRVGRGLLFPDYGPTVAQFLAQPQISPARRWQALEAALVALRTLHALVVRLPDGLDWAFSHGDATLSNVCYDPVTTTATWIDFEMFHDPKLPAVWRQADDLRALLFAAAAHMDVDQLERLLQLFAHYCSEPELWNTLRTIAAVVDQQPDPMHLAQTGIGLLQSQRLVAWLHT
jgi:hypothetical protein